MKPKVHSSALLRVVLIYLKTNKMRYLNLNWNYGYEVSEECEMYEFESDSLSQECYVESLNETESALECTLDKLMEIKNIACGEWVDEMSNKLNQ